MFPCRLSPGSAFDVGGTLTTHSTVNAPLADSTPLTGRQPEPAGHQATRSDARRTSNSVASRTILQRSPQSPRKRGRSGRGAPAKGSLDRRSKRVFAYFCLAAKVGAGSGGAEPPGRFEKRSRRGPTGAAYPQRADNMGMICFLRDMTRGRNAS